MRDPALNYKHVLVYRATFSAAALAWPWHLEPRVEALLGEG